MKFQGLVAAAFAMISTQALAAETVTIGAGTPGEATATVDGPADAAEAVLIVHDYFGVSVSMLAEAKYQAEQGRRAMVVDLYGGMIAEDDAQAAELMNGLEWDAARAKVIAAISELSEDGRPVRLVGYSMGGRLALEAALAAPDKVASAALIYGGGYEVVPDSLLGAAPPLLIVSGTDDEWSYPALRALQDRMTALDRPAEILVLREEKHGFAQSMFQKGANYDLWAVRSVRAVYEGFAARNP